MGFWLQLRFINEVHYKSISSPKVMHFKACWQPGSDKVLCPASNLFPLLIWCMEILLQIMRPLTDPHLIEPTEWDIIVRWSSRYCLHPWLHIIKKDCECDTEWKCPINHYSPKMANTWLHSKLLKKQVMNRQNHHICRQWVTRGCKY